MTEPEHEHDEDEAVGAPVSPETVVDADEEEAEAEAAETPAEEEPEASAEQAAQQVEWEKRFDKAEKSFATYTRRITDLWEEDATELVAFVFSPSAPMGFIDKRDAGRVPEEAKRVLLEWLGFAQEQEYEPDPQTRECHICKGKGKTSTGSHVPGKETRACPGCNGTGAEGLPNVLAQAQQNGHSEERYSVAEGVPAESADADNWGQPRILPDGRENPNWGRQPQYWVSVEPWGDTRNLTAQSEVV